MRAAFVTSFVTIFLSAAAMAAPPAVAPVGPPVAGPAVATLGDAVKGQARFKAVCGTCHSIDPAKKGIGPHLKGVVGRKAGTVDGYNYSPAMKAYGAVWDVRSLDPWLAKPGAVVKGTKMVNMVANAKDRADIIAYLATVK